MYSILQVNGLLCGLIKLRAGNLWFKLLTTDNLVFVIIIQHCNCCIVLSMKNCLCQQCWIFIMTKKSFNEDIWGGSKIVSIYCDIYPVLYVVFFCLAMNVGISKLALENHDKIAHFVQYGCILCNSSQATMSGFPEHQQIMFAWVSGAFGCGIV